MNTRILDDNRAAAERCGAIEAVVSAMETHAGNAAVCQGGCWALRNMSTGNRSVQKSVCEKGGLSALLGALGGCSNSSSGQGMLAACCCGAIGAVLSSQETHTKFCTPDVLRAARECRERHGGDEMVRQSCLGLAREEDAGVRAAAARGVCTKEAFPRCSDKCKCDEGAYCPRCCAQQRAFRCRTCDKSEVRFYCEACWERDHQGHEGEEFFCPVRCATKSKARQSEAKMK